MSENHAHRIPDELYLLPESVGAEDYRKIFDQGDLPGV